MWLPCSSFSIHQNTVQFQLLTSVVAAKPDERDLAMTKFSWEIETIRHRQSQSICHSLLEGLWEIHQHTVWFLRSSISISMHWQFPVSCIHRKGTCQCDWSFFVQSVANSSQLEQRTSQCLHVAANHVTTGLQGPMGRRRAKWGVSRLAMPHKHVSIQHAAPLPEGKARCLAHNFEQVCIQLIYGATLRLSCRQVMHASERANESSVSYKTITSWSLVACRRLRRA